MLIRRNIDFHIHTIKTLLDSGDYIFDIDYLKNHVEYNNLNAIAITNHNLFDKDQYLKIQEELIDTIVFPGVEVNIEQGHMLVIAPTDKVDDINSCSKKLNSKITTQESSISYDEFISIFPDYKDYLLIPHIDTKSPILKSSIIEKFTDNIIAGEVRNYKKFLSYKKAEGRLTPVVFSDDRMYYKNQGKESDFFSLKHTKIDVRELTIPNIKRALMDKTKVHIVNFEDSEYEFIPLLNDGTVFSNKLNLVVGKRSTGKTTILKKIQKNFSEKENSNIKFIEQFQITTESEDKNFEKILNSISNELNKDYYIKYQNIINNIVGIDFTKSEQIFDEYLNSLILYADNEDRTNEYSSTNLYREIEYSIISDASTKKLIESVEYILRNGEYKDLIEQYIEKDNLITLYNELKYRHKDLFITNNLKVRINSFIKDIQAKLSLEGGIDPIKSINYKDCFVIKTKVNKFNNLSNYIKSKEIVGEKKIYRFEIKSYKRKLNSISELKATFKTNKPLHEIFESYENDNLFKYIKALKEIVTDSSQIHKMLFYQETKIFNERKKLISHGERAEFNLLRHLDTALNYDLIMFDEPEASFDNLFINRDIVKILKDISKKTTVVVTTHNNNLGSSSKSDFILYTDFEYDDLTNDTKYFVYSGTFDSTELTTKIGRKIKTYDVLMETMEANVDAYDERKVLYENLKNRK